MNYNHFYGSMNCLLINNFKQNSNEYCNKVLRISNVSNNFAEIELKTRNRTDTDKQMLFNTAS